MANTTTDVQADDFPLNAFLDITMEKSGLDITM